MAGYVSSGTIGAQRIGLERVPVLHLSCLIAVANLDEEALR